MPMQQVRANFPRDADGNPYRPVPVQQVDAGGNLIIPGVAQSGVASVAGSSGNVANAAATATIAAVAGKTNSLSGFDITSSGAIAGSVVTATITGLLGGTQSLTIAVAAGVTVGNAPIVAIFNPPHPASAANTAITLSVPALGAGNTNSTANVRGIQA